VQKEIKDDKKLVEAAKADISNFKLLYEKYFKAVFRYAYNRLGRNRELAEDITSETFVKAIDKFHTYRYQNKPFVVWLYTIAHNLIINHYRSKEENKLSLDSSRVISVEDADEMIDKLSREELKEKIKEKVSELPDDLNNIFSLRHTEELTFAQIGKLLGEKEQTVKMRYYRGIQSLKDLVVNDKKYKLSKD